MQGLVGALGLALAGDPMEPVCKPRPFLGAAEPKD